MLHDVIAAEYAGEYRLRVSFENGVSGVVDFSALIKRNSIYSKLLNKDYFKRFQINEELGVITWPDEIDIAPETLYAEATGEPYPAWMT